MLEVVQLYKTLKNGLLFIGGNTTTCIPYIETDFFVFGRIITNGNASLIGVFDSIGEVISKYLHQTVLFSMDIAFLHTEFCYTFHVCRHPETESILKFTDTAVYVYIGVAEVQ